MVCDSDTSNITPTYDLHITCRGADHDGKPPYTPVDVNSYVVMYLAFSILFLVPGVSDL